MKKLCLATILIALPFLGFGTKRIEARVLPPLAFPIPELANCTSVQDCELYCDRVENYTTCTKVGKTWGLIDKSKVLAAETPSDEELKAEAKRLGITFPIVELGNCASVSECTSYCDQTQNYQACTDFGRRHKLVEAGEPVDEEPSDEELTRRAREHGVTFPVAELGNCASPRACMTYCDEPAHETECRDFAQGHGFEEGPPGVEFPIPELGNCRNERECKDWCEDEAHRRVCFEWAKRHGYIDEGEEFGGPGGCMSDEECEDYCQENPDECTRWCEQNPDKCEGHEGGPREGPGGCKNERECQDYCQQNPAECRNWCDDHPEKCEDGERKFEKCKTEEECKRYCEEHPNDPDCKWKDEEKEGEGHCPTREACETYCRDHPDYYGCQFLKEDKWDKDGKENGHCQTKESCEVYCREHPDYYGCQFLKDDNFWKEKESDLDTGSGYGEEYAEDKKDFTGPGGCSNYEECLNHCAEHPEECPGFSR